MDYFLIGGAPSSGKSEAITRLVDYLIQQKNFVRGNLSSLSQKDFFCTLDGKDKNNNSIKILVTSATDTFQIIDRFALYAKNNNPYKFVISSIRDEGDSMRHYFFRKMNVTSNDYCFEMPLAKITRRTTWAVAHQWYKDKIDFILNDFIGRAPFNI